MKLYHGGMRWKRTLAVCLLVGSAMVTYGKVIDWTGNANLNWDTSSVNWTNGTGPQIYADADDVTFRSWVNHYLTYNIVIAPEGVTPNSIAIKSVWEGIRWRFSGGDIKGATGMDIKPRGVGYDWPTIYVNFDGYTNSLSFSGGLNIGGSGRNLYFSPTLMGFAYGLGSGTITLQRASSFTFSPTVTNCTLTNDIIVASGYTNYASLDFANAPTFTGTIFLDGDLFFPTVGGGYMTCTFNGDFIMSSNRTLYLGNRDIAAGFNIETFNGRFMGTPHTLTLDFKGSGGGANIAIRVPHTNAFLVANLIVTNVYTPFTAASGGLQMNQTDASNNFFQGIRDNGGKVKMLGGRILARRGGLDCPLLYGDTNSLLFIDQSASGYDVNLLNSPLFVNATGNVARVKINQSTGAAGTLRGHVTVGTGGVYTLEGMYNSACEHYDGDLTLLGGSTIDVTGWGLGGMGYLNHWYEFQDSTQKLRLGDGDPATFETITFRGIEQTTGVNASNGVFFMSIASSNVVDDGGTILRYQALNGIGVVNYGWTGLKSVQGYSSGVVDYQFRGGSAGTVFAPTPSNEVGAVGMITGTVFVVSNLTRHVTRGNVGFYNSGAPAWGGHRSYLGNVMVNAGGIFTLEATGTVMTASLIVTNGGQIGGSGTFVATNGGVKVYGGTISPGFNTGTLNVNSNLSLSTNTVLSFELNQPAGPSNDLLAVTGNLTLDGTLNVAPAGAKMSAGSYTIMTYSGSLTDNGLIVGTMPLGLKGQVTTGGGVVTLTATASSATMIMIR